MLGVYASFENSKDEDPQMGSERILLFRKYLWGEDAQGGLAAKLKTLNRSYGDGLNIVLFQFKVLPIGVSDEEGRTLENFRPKEKSIGVWIPITDGNFFDKNQSQRDNYVANEIIGGLKDLRLRMSHKDNNVNIERLISDTIQLFE